MSKKIEPGKELTRAEEEVMQILWKLGKGFVKDVLAQMNEPKPAYNTVSTIIRILEKKGFVSYKAYGKTHEYFPLISKENYSKQLMHGVINRYFSNSFQRLVSFFSDDKSISIKDLEEIRQIMDAQIAQKKQKVQP